MLDGVIADWVLYSVIVVLLWIIADGWFLYRQYRWSREQDRIEAEADACRLNKHK